MEVKFITVTSNGYKVELNPTEIHPTTVVLTDVVRNPYFLLGDGRYAVATKFKVSPSSIIVEDYVPVVGEVPAFYENTLIKVLERHRLVEEKVQEEIDEVSPTVSKEYFHQALGWWYAEACTLADKGIDIRKQNFLTLIDKMKKDLASE
jgi:hypothetical protein